VLKGWFSGSLLRTMKNRPLVDWVLATLREAAWAPLSIFGFYMLGLGFHLFGKFPYLDIPTHFMGGVVITFFYRSAVRNSQGILGTIPPLIQILFAFTCTGTTAILWEFYENILDHFFGLHMVRGLEDTIIDLFTGLLGALVLSVLYRRR